MVPYVRPQDLAWNQMELDVKRTVLVWTMANAIVGSQVLVIYVNLPQHRNLSWTVSNFVYLNYRLQGCRHLLIGNSHVIVSDCYQQCGIHEQILPMTQC